METFQKITLTLLIPSYNEENRIEPTLRDYLTNKELNDLCDLKIVPVLNGCRDDTLGVVQKVKNEFNNKIEIIEEKAGIGKGGALILGFSQKWNTDFVGFTDADNSTTPEMFARLVKEMIADEKLDCAIASRYIEGSKIKGKAFTRIIMSETFSTIVNLLFWLKIRDTQCGAKILKTSSLAKILPELKIKNMSFDVNLLVSLKKNLLKIKEVPIEWQDDQESSLTGKAHITSFLMLWSLIRMRISLSPFKTLYRKVLMPLDKWMWVNKMKQNWEEF